MDDEFDPAEETRKMCLCLVGNIADRAASVGHFMLTDTGSFIDAAQDLEMYITDGRDVAVICNPDSEKFVR